MSDKKLVRIGFVAIAVLVALLIVLIVKALPTGDGQSDAASPVVVETETVQNSQDHDAADQLLVRVHEFEVLYYGFDWKDPERRYTQLAAFMLPEALAELRSAEQNLPQYQEAIARETVRSVDLAFIDAGEVLTEGEGIVSDGDLAEVSTTLSLRAEWRERDETTGVSRRERLTTHDIPSHTAWVRQGGTWLVYEVS